MSCNRLQRTLPCPEHMPATAGTPAGRPARSTCSWALRLLLPMLLGICCAAAPAYSADALSQGFSAYIRQDYTASRRTWEPLAAAGDPVAAYYLGLMYHFGTGGPQDNAKAMAYYGQAARKGLANAQYNLALLLCPHATCPPANATEAAPWLILAAEAGLPEAQYTLGLLYASGRGVARDDELAYLWFFLAAARGHLEAQQSLENAATRLGSEQLRSVQARAAAWRPR